MSLQSIAAVCGQRKLPGTKSKLYLIPKGEIVGWPKTEAAIKIAASQVPEIGDTKILGEAFTLVPDTGKGYFRTFDILMDTGAVKDELEGDLGGQGFKSSIPFTIVGTEAEQLEFADTVVAYSGCLVAVLETRTGTRRVLGEPDLPAVVESIKGGTGQKNGDINGFEYVLKASTGLTAPIYKKGLALNVTPN